MVNTMGTVWKSKYKSDSACPVAIHPKVLGALTLHTGVRNRHMKCITNRHKNGRREKIMAGFPTFW